MTGFIPTEFIIQDNDFPKMPASTQAAVQEFLKGVRFDPKIEKEIQEEIEKQKGLGYVYSEIQRVNLIKIMDFENDNVRYQYGADIRLPHTSKRIPLYLSNTEPAYYSSPTYTKTRNSQGAALRDRLVEYFDVKRAERAAREAQEAQEKEGRARIRAEDEARKEAERQAREAAKKPEEDFILSWIQDHGSDRLKKAVQLNLSFKGLFKREWATFFLGPEARVFQDKDWIEEFEPGTPCLEQMQKYEEALIWRDSVECFDVSVDLSEVRVMDPEERDQMPEYEYPDTKLAIVYEVQAATLNTFWIIQYI